MTESPATPSSSEPGSTSGADGPPTLDLSLLLRGNWVGAAMTAVAAFGVAGVVSLITAFAGADDLDFKSGLSMTALLTEASFGADFISDESGHIGQFPLLATLLALAAAVMVFRRVTSTYADTSAVFADVVRAGLILSVMTTLLAIVIKIVEPDLRGFNLEEADSENGVAWASFLLQDVSGKVTISIPGAIFLPFLLLVPVLAIACVLRGDWSRSRPLSTMRAWLTAPLAGLAALLVGLFVAGLIYLLAIEIHVEDARSLSGVIGMLSLLPALGLRMIGLGSGAGFGLSYEFGEQDNEEMKRLSGFADEVGGLFWVAPLVALVIAAFAVWTVIRRSPDRTKVLRDVAVYLGVLVVALPFLAKFSNLTGGEGSGDDESSFWLGIDGVETTLFFVLISAAVAVLLLILSGSLDLATLKEKAAALQSHPGQPQQQWGQQPAAGNEPATPPVADSPPAADGPPPTTPHSPDNQP